MMTTDFEQITPTPAPITCEYITPPPSLQDLTEYAQRHGYDLVIMHGKSEGGTLVYVPATEVLQCRLIRATQGMQTLHSLRRELTQERTDAPDAQDAPPTTGTIPELAAMLTWGQDSNTNVVILAPDPDDNADTAFYQLKQGDTPGQYVLLRVQGDHDTQESA